MDQVCAECNRLLDDCAEAIKAHVKLIGQKQLAEMEQRSNVLNELEPLVAAASEERARARKAFKDHVATHENPGQGSTVVTT